MRNHIISYFRSATTSRFFVFRRHVLFDMHHEVRADISHSILVGTHCGIIGWPPAQQSVRVCLFGRHFSAVPIDYTSAVLEKSTSSVQLKADSAILKRSSLKKFPLERTHLGEILSRDAKTYITNNKVYVLAPLPPAHVVHPRHS